MIDSESYEGILESYTSALDWMRNIGVNLGAGRTSNYQSIVSYWTGSYRTASLEEGQRIFPSFVSSMLEIHDFVSVYKAFKDVPVAKLGNIVAKLNKAVNGPINLEEETPVSATARNFLFEALVAARIHSPAQGASAILDAPSDTGVLFEGSKIWVECKRVTSEGKIEKNVRKASSQLEEIFKKKTGSGHRGMVALDVSKILNPGDRIYVRENDAHLLQSVDRLMNDLIERFAPVWQKVYERRDRKVIGTIVRFAFMSTSEERNLLVHTAQWGLNPRVGTSGQNEKIQEKLVSALDIN
ncbi:MAG: hypothetical protein LAT63_04140 [Marinobacter sp.]|nr:hypothetical protein [Marinobacter sp.]